MLWVCRPAESVLTGAGRAADQESAVGPDLCRVNRDRCGVVADHPISGIAQLRVVGATAAHQIERPTMPRTNDQRAAARALVQGPEHVRAPSVGSDPAILDEVERKRSPRSLDQARPQRIEFAGKQSCVVRFGHGLLT